jgi:phosphoribosylformylglycinamidine synthase
MSQVKRIFVEKKTEYNAEAKTYYSAIKNHLKISHLKGLRILNRYDIEGLSEEQFRTVLYTVFAEANTDTVYEEEVKTDYKDTTFAVSYLPGQYNQRADSAVQCVQIITKAENVVIKNARIFILRGELTEKEVNRIKKYIINPVDSMEALQSKPNTLAEVIDSPKMVKTIEGFTDKSKNELEELIDVYALAMSIEDMLLIKDYFFTENRNPTITELKVLDTYWSDHCRHTTFNTHIIDVDFQKGDINEAVKDAFEQYKKLRQQLYISRDKAISLMDIATIYSKKAKKDGILYDIEESDEINACSIKTKAVVDGKTEDWLVMFKNETHNHPTEIEPFGGAATCLGGAIRDPLSGRSYVYQAMRVTGCADCTQDMEKTIKGKLPQIKITTEAAAGFSSYGNQIGLATGQVKEYYHEGFLAKRMEVGAVIAAAKAKNIRRLAPKNGDIIILLGGRTGRDGIGGAVGSSKAHTDVSVKKSGSEVQKGNPVEERKLQRLFRNSKAARMIKKCNDFGAGGVSVAIGELAESLDIFLDRVPKKYEGLDGTEIAISESQERMAVLLDKNNAKAFMDLAHEENIEATIVAQVTDSDRLKIFWRGQEIVNISRAFLDTNGANRQINISVNESQSINYFKGENNTNTDIEDIMGALLSDINTACNKGLVEQFDSTIGASNILMPFGGKYQLTPTDGMASKLPVYDTETATVMTHGYNPYLAEQSLFHGGVYSVLIALSKMTAMGADYKKARLSMQEYFEKLLDDPKKWAKPFSALLGAFEAQSAMQTPAIGGKDSMSGTFMDLNVPPNIICFAVAVCDGRDIISPEIKNTDSKLFVIHLKRDANALPDYEYAKIMFETIHKMIKDQKIFAAKTIANEKPLAALIKMGLGNKIGLYITAGRNILLSASDGDIIVEINDTMILEQFDKRGLHYNELAITNDSKSIRIEEKIFTYDDLFELWNEKLSSVFPVKAEYEKKKIPQIHYENKVFRKCNIKTAKPVVFIPAFPGTNCEIDTAMAFEKAGAKTEIFVFKNLCVSDIMKSIEQMAKCIQKSNIIALPGGFSAGDEPDGSGKFIVSIFKNELIKNTVHSLLDNRDGLMLGICNGFQALIKLGLLPYGRITDIKPTSPTLTFNTIGRHISSISTIKVVSNMSVWLKNAELGKAYKNVLSHGEGRFVADEKILKTLKENNQIAFQYVDYNNNAVYDSAFNLNGSAWAIEGITSPDGRILGKMGHSERVGKYLYKNIPGEFDIKLFESAVEYFK